MEGAPFSLSLRSTERHQPLTPIRAAIVARNVYYALAGGIFSQTVWPRSRLRTGMRRSNGDSARSTAPAPVTLVARKPEFRALPAIKRLIHHALSGVVVAYADHHFLRLQVLEYLKPSIIIFTMDAHLSARVMLDNLREFSCAEDHKCTSIVKS